MNGNPKMLDIVIFSSDSYLPRANVCVESCKQFIPEAKIHLVPFNNPTNGDYVSGLAKARLEYTKKLLEEGSSEVMVLGADCVFYAPPNEFLYNRSNVVLVPHVLKPPMENGAGLYKTGHVNGDLILFRKNSLEILDWLLSQDMKDDSSNGVFYEQTWLSALPFIFDNVGICRHPGINYAYFNFVERELTQLGFKYFVNGSPLTMAQFSGWSPGKISKYFNGEVSPLTLELFQDYERRISK